MKSKVFYMVDVFAEAKYAGNQLAVFRDAGDLSEEGMQRLAQEMNYSETTFILSEEERDGGWDVRIFTPQAELPFAGHPTLGTAYIIRREIIGKPVDRVDLNLGVGRIPVTFGSQDGDDSGPLWMKQIEPTTGQTLAAGPVADVLTLDTSDLDSRFPIQEVSTGSPVIIVPLRNLDALKQISIDTARYYRLIDKIDGKVILAFCPETRHGANHLSVRFFAHYIGIPEDPATGSANGCLAGYLVANRYFGTDSIDIRVEQGHEIGRPSLLLLRAAERAGRIDIHVGGNVILVARGELA